MEIVFSREDDLWPAIEPSDSHHEYATDLDSWVENGDSEELVQYHHLSFSDRIKVKQRAMNLYLAWSHAVYPGNGDPLRDEPCIMYIPGCFYREASDSDGFLILFKAENNGNTYRFHFGGFDFADGEGSTELSEENLLFLKIFKEKNEHRKKGKRVDEKKEATSAQDSWS